MRGCGGIGAVAAEVANTGPERGPCCKAGGSGVVFVVALVGVVSWAGVYGDGEVS